MINEGSAEGGSPEELQRFLFARELQRVGNLKSASGQTDCVTLLLPGNGKQKNSVVINRATRFLRDELGKTASIKSKTTRQNAQESIRSIQHRLSQA
jgi:peptide subunit release factor 1 (eRF1)